MAEVKVSIGGREFEVACRNGEEHFLQSAAALLDNEADALNEALGRMPETRMLLMAGLMLADKTASLEDRLKSAPTADGSVPDEATRKRAVKAEAQVDALQAELAETKAQIAEAQAKAEANAKVEQQDLALKNELEAAKALIKETEEKAQAYRAEAKEANEFKEDAIKTMQGMIDRVEEVTAGLKKAG